LINTLFVFVDNALGPWLPLVADRPHVMHCHDFLALRSALDEEVENPTSRTGQQYQKYIQRGFQKGRHFISDSYSTKEDLHRFVERSPVTSELVYVGLNPLFQPQNPTDARVALSKLANRDLSEGYLLHVGGNQWYKNRMGVLELYEAVCQNHGCSLPLLLIGQKPSAELLAKKQTSFVGHSIHFLTGLTDEQVCTAYAGTSLFLFPSLAEGFGWPIAEAMASGCPVLTTNEAPMTEVAGGAATLIDRRPRNKAKVNQWAADSAKVINKVLSLPVADRDSLIQQGFENARRFEIHSYIDEVEQIYERVLTTYGYRVTYQL
jgi:glycosyltransferase involved in cell wall biosynthesis